MIDDESGAPVWINAAQVQALTGGGEGRTRLDMVGGGTRIVRGAVAEVATQLQDALVGRKYVDFWSS